MNRYLTLILLSPTFLFAQSACIGVQLTSSGEVVILLPNEPPRVNVGDSVHYISENESTIIKTTASQFSGYLTLVNQQDYLKQIIREREAWPFHETKAPKPTFQKPNPAQPIPDYFWPDSNLTLKSKIGIRKMLKTYVAKNYTVYDRHSNRWRYSSIREAVIYEYEGKRLTGVLSYNEEYIPITYDQLYYNFLGQLTTLHRKYVGETGGITYTFHYDENNKLVHFNVVHAGFFREGYEQSTQFHCKYFKYDKSGLLSAICQQDNFSKTLRVVKWIQK